MKKYIYKLSLLSVLLTGLYGCEEDKVFYKEDFVTFSNASSTALSALENAGTFNIPVSLTLPQTTDLVVNFTLTDGSARKGVDYNVTGTSVTIPAGQLSANIVVSLIDNTILNPAKDFTVKLAGTSNPNFGLGLSGQLGTISKTVAIINDDCPTKSSIWLGNISLEDVGYATTNGVGSGNATGTCDVLVIRGDLPGFGTPDFLPITFVFTPSALNAPTGTVVAARQTFCNTCNSGGATTYEASGTYNETTKTINVNYSLKRANGTEIYAGTNIIRKP